MFVSCSRCLFPWFVNYYWLSHTVSAWFLRFLRGDLRQPQRRLVECMNLRMWQENRIPVQSADVSYIHLESAAIQKVICSQSEDKPAGCDFGNNFGKIPSFKSKNWNHWRFHSAPDWLGLKSSWNAQKVSLWRTSNVSADNSRKYPPSCTETQCANPIGQMDFVLSYLLFKAFEGRHSQHNKWMNYLDESRKCWCWLRSENKSLFKAFLSQSCCCTQSIYRVHRVYSSKAVVVTYS